MALAFIKTAYDWATGNAMPEDMRERQERMERRHLAQEQHQQNNDIGIVRPRRVPPTVAVSLAAYDTDNDQNNNTTTNTLSEDSSSSSTTNNNKFDNILDVKRRSFVDAETIKKEEAEAEEMKTKRRFGRTSNQEQKQFSTKKPHPPCLVWF